MFQDRSVALVRDHVRAEDSGRLRGRDHAAKRGHQAGLIPLQHP